MNAVVSLATPIIKHSLSRPQEPPKSNVPRADRAWVTRRNAHPDKTPAGATTPVGRDPWSTYKKNEPLGLVNAMHDGGGGGIRTLVRGVPVNGFRDRRIQPLCHSSVGCENGTRSNWMRAAESSGGESGI